MGKMTRCKTCGAEIAKDAKFCTKCGAKQKKHKALGIVLVVFGVFLFIAGIGGFNSSPDDTEDKKTDNIIDTSTPSSLSEPDSAGEENEEKTVPENKPTISKDEFEAISSGMTYEEVVEIVGSDGELLSESDLGIGDAYKSSIYMWKGEGSWGANANVTFQGGKVISKAQIGLE